MTRACPKGRAFRLLLIVEIFPYSSITGNKPIPNFIQQLRVRAG
jgi:hypothetical protein